MVKILLVEDNPIDAFIAQKVVMLSGADVRLEIADGAVQALALLTNQHREGYELPDLILIDQYMPVTDGLQFLDALALLNIPGKEKILKLMLTNSADPHLVAEAIRRGASGMLSKPLSIPILNDLILLAQPRDPQAIINSSTDQ